MDKKKNSEKSPNTQHKVVIYPEEKTFYSGKGENLFNFLLAKGLNIQGPCGGMGICGKCAVKIKKGCVAPKSSEKDHLSNKAIAEGWRLACKQYINRDIYLELPEASHEAEYKEKLSEDVKIKLLPGVIQTYNKFPQPKKEDNLSDTDLIAKFIGNKKSLSFTYSSLKKLPYKLREIDFFATVVHTKNKVLDIYAGKKDTPLYGVAIDVGTTTLAVYLLNLNTGKELAVRSAVNPQQQFGFDVISRIKHIHNNKDKGLKDLREAVCFKLNDLIKELSAVAEICANDVYKLTVVGNPIMLHLFTGISPAYIDHSPYTPVFHEGLELSAEELHLQINPEAQILIFPSISGYIGADITSGTLFSGLHRKEKLSLLVDLGTNAEIVLGNSEHIKVCSAPAGPAFEGARIKYGMSADPGAINHASIENVGEESKISFDVIGDTTPKGICGSGLIDIIDVFCKLGILDTKGTFNENNSSYSKCMKQNENELLEFLLSDEKDNKVYITQEDIREFQFAKGAIRTGIDVLLKEWQLEYKDIDKIYLAGAFGNFIRSKSLVDLGMFPPFNENKIFQLGNAAGKGAKMALLNYKKWNEVKRMAKEVNYFELSSHKDFGNLFMKSMYFPEM